MWSPPLSIFLPGTTLPELTLVGLLPSAARGGATNGQLRCRDKCAFSGCSCFVQPLTPFRLASGRCPQLLRRSPPARPSSWRRRIRRLQSWRTCQPQRWQPLSAARGWSLRFVWPFSNAPCVPAFSHAPPAPRQAALVSSTAGPPDAAPFAVAAIGLLKLGEVLLGE